MNKDQEVYRRYEEKVKQYERKGHAKRMSSNGATVVRKKTWYLPHHPVFHPAKPNKVRIVFDTAAKYQGTSLNDNLVQGPHLTNEVVDVLLRFRTGEVPVIVDIQEMSHQVRTSPPGRDALRFIALRCRGFIDIIIYVMKAVEKDFYVDGILKSFSSDRKAIAFAKDLMELLLKGGFCLTKWSSLSKEVLVSFPEEERADPSLNLDLDQLPVKRALGIHWIMKDDTFKFNILKLDNPETKQGVLATIASLYVLLGLATSITLVVKALLQRLRQANFQPMSYGNGRSGKKAYLRLHKSRYLVVILEAFTLCSVLCSAKIRQGKATSLLADASAIGYGAVSYMRITYSDGTVMCAFVMGKSRTAPLRKIVISRQELLAAVISIRLSERIQREFVIEFSEVYYWTDSEVVLKYERKRFTV